MWFHRRLWYCRPEWRIQEIQNIQIVLDDKEFGQMEMKFCLHTQIFHANCLLFCNLFTQYYTPSISIACMFFILMACKSSSTNADSFVSGIET